MKFLLLIGLFLFSCLNAWSQDSTIRKYFVCESRSFFMKSLIIEQGQLIWVKDTSGIKLRGKLTILNDSFFKVYNELLDSLDTFDIGSIVKVRKPTMAGAIIGPVFIVGGGAAIFASYPILQDPGAVSTFFGIYLAAQGMSLLGGGVQAIFGKKFYHPNYKYHIVITKGYELRRKHIKSLKR